MLEEEHYLYDAVVVALSAKVAVDFAIPLLGSSALPKVKLAFVS